MIYTYSKRFQNRIIFPAIVNETDVSSNNRRFSSKTARLGPNLLKCYCWKLHQMLEAAQNSVLVALTPMGKAASGHFH